MTKSNGNRHGRRPSNSHYSSGKPHRDGQRRGKPAGNGFSRPGPFGFKPKPISESQQMVANPFGFASHNKGADAPHRSSDERRQSRPVSAHQNLRAPSQPQDSGAQRPQNGFEKRGDSRPHKSRIRKPRRGNFNNSNRDANKSISTESPKASEPADDGR